MAGVPAPKVAQSSRNYTPGQVLSSPIFWILVMFVMVSASGLMATAQIAPIAKDLRRREHNHFFRGHNTYRCTDHR